MNRRQRRRLEQKGFLVKGAPGLTLQDWLSRPEMVCRRGEAWEMMWRAIAANEIYLRHNRWYWRLLRWVRGLFGERHTRPIHPSLGYVGPEEADEAE